MTVQLGSFALMNRYLSGTANANRNNPAQGADKTEAFASVIVEVGSVETVKEQTLDDVKKEFYDYLDSLPISAGLGNTPINVTISDAAFERMQTDPEYKQRMKDLCKRDLCDPGWNNRGAMGPPTYMHIQITPDTDNKYNSEYLATSYNSGATSSNFKSESENSFWSRRTKKREEAEEMREKRLEEREAFERLLGRLREQRALMEPGASADGSFSAMGARYPSASPAAQTGALLAEA